MEKKIEKAWSLSYNIKGKSKEKIDKYFNKGLKECNYYSTNISGGKKENQNMEVLTTKVIDSKKTDKTDKTDKINKINKTDKIKQKVKETEKIAKQKVKDFVSHLDKLVDVPSKKNEEKKEVKKTEYIVFEDLIKELEGGDRLSENKLSCIKFLMSYIRTRKALNDSDNMRLEIDNLFKDISGVLHNDEDKLKFLHLYQEQRFLSLYEAYCRTVVYSITDKIKKCNFPEDKIKMVENNILKYLYGYVDILKSNESEYIKYTKKLKNINDGKSYDTINNIESIRKIQLINKLISDGKFTGEKSKYLTELTNDLDNSKVVDFFNKKMNVDIESLQSEYDSKLAGEKNEYNENMVKIVTRIKDVLTKESVPAKIIELVEKKINDKKYKVKIDNLDLILKLLQWKKINPRKISNDIEKYIELSSEELKSKISDAISLSMSFKGRFFSIFNDFKNKIMNFISPR